MATKFMALAGGIMGATLLSQVPEFSQQYLQRLGGRVDELRLLVEQCDADAATTGRTCVEALPEMKGTEFLDARRRSTEDAVVRLASLEHDLQMLELSSPLERLWQPYRFADPATLQGTWEAYRPAVPMTTDGLMSSAVGFIVGAMLAPVAIGAFAMVALVSAVS
jgi:Protein of unknown function (DUF2937)